MASYVTSTAGIVYSSSDGKTISTQDGEMYVMSNSGYVPYNVTEEYRGADDELKNDLYADQDSIISVGHTNPNLPIDDDITVVYVSSPTKGFQPPAGYSTAVLANAAPMPTYTTMAPTNFAALQPASMAVASSSAGMYAVATDAHPSYTVINPMLEGHNAGVHQHAVVSGTLTAKQELHSGSACNEKAEDFDQSDEPGGDRRAREAYRKRVRRESESAEQAVRRRAKNLEAKRRRMARESEEERAARRNRDAEAKRMRRQRETPEQRERRLKRDSERMRRARRMKKYGPKVVLAEQETDSVVDEMDAYQDVPGTSQTIEVAASQPSALSHDVSNSYVRNSDFVTPGTSLATHPQHIIAQQPTYTPATAHPAAASAPAVSYPASVQQPQPTVITLPLPLGTGNTGPLMIHLTLPENIRPEQIQFSAQTGTGAQPQQIIIQSGNTQPPLAITVSQQPATSSAVPATHVDNRPPSVEYVPAPMKSGSQLPSDGTSASSLANPGTRYRNLSGNQIELKRQANAERSRRRRAAETPEQRAERNRKTAERMREKRAEVRQTGVVREKTELTADRFEEIFQSVLHAQSSRPVKAEPMSALEEDGYADRAEVTPSASLSHESTR